MTKAIENYPQMKAKTVRFSLGTVRRLQAVGDGSHALFLRSADGFASQQSLWLSEFPTDGGHRERLLVDPSQLSDELDGAVGQLDEQAKAIRERSRESAAGITDYSVDSVGQLVTFTLNNQLFLTDLLSGQTSQLASTSPVIRPVISPNGRRVAYTTGDSVHVVDIRLNADVALVSAAARGETDVTYGLADFIAGEEMDRYDGLWWSPDSRHLLVQRTDQSPVKTWYISDPAHPDRAARPHRYPQALTANARVDLLAFAISHEWDERTHVGTAVSIHWDHQAFEYLARVNWDHGQAPLLLVQDRQQDQEQILVADVRTGSTNLVAEQGVPADPQTGHHRWLDIIPGLPARAHDGSLLSATFDLTADRVRLARRKEAFSSPDWQILALLAIEDEAVIACAAKDPRSHDLVRFGFDGSAQVLSPGPGLWSGSWAGNGHTRLGRTMGDVSPLATHTFTDEEGVERTAELKSHNEEPGFLPTTEFVRLGRHQLEAAITWPTAASGQAGGRRLPILLTPYSGPGAQQALFAQAYYWDAQWWADQGFAVVTIDGRGTPARGLSWEYAISESFAEVSLADQLEGLQALKASDQADRLDFDKVAIIGWSYGGFLAALGVLRGGQQIKAAVAGAPPVDWTLYDTHYTERYLGLDRQTYQRNSLLEDADQLERPLLLVHGFADDNVTIAGSLQLSQALLAAGKQHYVLPLTGITHMTSDPVVAQNLLTAQRDFLRQALDL